MKFELEQLTIAKRMNYTQKLTKVYIFIFIYLYKYTLH